MKQYEKHKMCFKILQNNVVEVCCIEHSETFKEMFENYTIVIKEVENGKMDNNRIFK